MKLKINSKQKRTVIITLILIFISIIVWILFGGEIFTKSEVLIEKKDELLGTDYKEWQDKFVLGLDYTLAVIAAIFFIGSTVTFLQRDKQTAKDETQ